MEEALIASSAIAIAVLHSLAFTLGWYWNPCCNWIDIPLHLLGGFFAAGFSWWFAKKFTAFDVFPKGRLKNIIVFVSLAALIGVFWEFFEFGFDYFYVASGRFNWLNYAQPSKADTMADLLNDLLGGLVAALVFGRNKKREMSI